MALVKLTQLGAVELQIKKVLLMMMVTLKVGIALNKIMDEWERFWGKLNKPWYARGPWNLILLLFWVFIDTLLGNF